MKERDREDINYSVQTNARRNLLDSEKEDDGMTLWFETVIRRARRVLWSGEVKFGEAVR